MNRSTSNPLDNFLQTRMRDGNISSTTLVFTFFCDVKTQHGGEIWLGSIIHALAPLGINERLTRTAVFRLVQDGWLESRKQGRRSYYRLTQTGQHYYQRAATRIYASSKPGWDGVWTLLFVSLVPGIEIVSMCQRKHRRTNELLVQCILRAGSVATHTIYAHGVLLEFLQCRW